MDADYEGRALWRSVADALSILIGGNAGEVGFSVLGTLLAGSSPLSTRQLLLVNLLTDMFPAMAVAVTPSDDPSTAAHAASGPMGLDVLGAPLLRAIRRRGVTTCLGAVTAYLIGRLTPGTERRSTTMALCGVVGAQLAQTLSGRRHSPLVWVTALGSAAVLAALVQTPGVSHFFGCTPLGPLAWSGVALAIALSALAPRLERLQPVRHLYGAASRLALYLGDTVRQARHLLHSGIARPVA
ncbi:ATPase [Streptomyces viridosporus ATCC 14672]|uniref:ATPase n=1 Tax=Streptomyces viridosporus (strain ATCC 14672 / DSM 40746 / JCM 4963 / KCTC 9882 / NRRL B-12104 / FH 1290) TaxID=566461 RepID=D6A0Z9_STRV1|nr:ATPase [Streptomyces viridosporus ATCC 14672]